MNVLPRLSGTMATNGYLLLSFLKMAGGHYGEPIHYAPRQNLADAERGYFGFYYNEEDWETSANGEKFINNAHVVTWSKYEIIHRLAKRKPIIQT